MSLKVSLLLPNLRCGGAERVAVNLANEFVERGYAVDMVLLSATGELRAELRPDVNVVDLGVKRLRWALLPLVRYLRQSRPAALLALMWPITVIALWARSFALVPTRVLVAEHCTWSKSELLTHSLVGWLVRTTMHHSFPRANGIVAVSKGAADDLARFANLDYNSITSIYNPVVGASRTVEATERHSIDWWKGARHKLLAVGTLKTIKDYNTLLNAFALLRKRMDARLLILGEGGCRAALEELARQLGVESSVLMPGFVNDPSLYYQCADLHVLSSISEGLSMVIIEALAAGTPVVSTDCPFGPREILRDGQFGRLVPVGDAIALADAMFETLTTPHDTAALRVRAQDFSIANAANRYLELLLPQASSERRG